MPFSAMRLLVLAAAVAALSVPTAAASSVQRDSLLVRREALEREVVRELNRVREARDLRPLRFGGGLRTAAARHSRAMLELGFFEHESADGTTFDDRIRRYYRDQGWESWTVAETLLSSSVEIGARQIVDAWVESRPHRTIILSSAWRDAGIGVYYADVAPGDFGDAAAFVVTADFGARAGKAASYSAQP
jgi:uncharacterized protein YkwD